MRIRATATWNPRKIASLKIPRGQGFLVVQVAEAYRAKIGEALAQLNEIQEKKYQKANAKFLEADPGRVPVPTYEDALVELEIDVTIHYRKRSIEANNLWWKLLEIEANWINGNTMYRDGYWSKKLPDHVVTPQEIHDDEIETYAVKMDLYVPTESLAGFIRGVEQEVGRVVEKIQIGDGKTTKVVVCKTTSYLDSKEFTVWLKRKIDQITDSGLLKSDEPEFVRIREDFKEIVKGEKK